MFGKVPSRPIYIAFGVRETSVSQSVSWLTLYTSTVAIFSRVAVEKVSSRYCCTLQGNHPILALQFLSL